MINIDLTNPEAYGYTLASSLIFLSILLSGLLIGLGKAIKSKKLTSFGLEELTEAIINSAILGAFATIIFAVNSLSNETFEFTDINQNYSDGSTNLKDFCINQGFNLESNIESLQCNLAGVQDLVFQNLNLAQNINFGLSYYSSLSFDFGIVSLSPLKTLESAYSQISKYQDFLLSLNLSYQTLFEFLNLIKVASIAFFLPLGLILRSFFITRKLGGMFIGISLSFYIIFPSLISILTNYEDQSNKLSLTKNQMQDFLNQNNLTIYPVADITTSVSNGEVFQTIDSLNQTQFVDSLIIIQKSAISSLSLSTISIFIPIFAFLISSFFAKTIGSGLGEEHLFIWRQI